MCVCDGERQWRYSAPYTIVTYTLVDRGAGMYLYEVISLSFSLIDMKTIVIVVVVAFGMMWMCIFGKGAQTMRMFINSKYQ